MRRRGRTIGALVMLGLLEVGPTLAQQTDVQQYYDSLRDVCQTGVTPAMTAAWVRARKALDAARYGGGRDSNFAGIKSPTESWLDCFQSPGEGKL